MKANKLTRKQEEILIFIKKYIAKNEYPPTVREITKAVNLSSPATVHVHLQNLIEKGYIKRNKKNKRILEVLVPNEFIQINNNEIIIPLINNKKNSSFKILKDYVLNYEQVIGYKIDNNNLINLGIYTNDILIFEITNNLNENDIILIKKSTKHEITKYSKDINIKNIVGRLIRLYREY